MTQECFGYSLQVNKRNVSDSDKNDIKTKLKSIVSKLVQTWLCGREASTILLLDLTPSCRTHLREEIILDPL